jgi:hypothetical protein
MSKSSTFILLLSCSVWFSLIGCGTDDNSSIQNANRANSNMTVAVNTSSNTSVTSNTSNANTSVAAGEETLPEFPYPPNASVSMKIPNGLLVKSDDGTTFRDVDLILQGALSKEGYERRGYYRVPLEGSNFVLTTPLEQFLNDGSPRYGAERFTENVVYPSVISAEFFENLLQGRTGRYRLIAFIISSTAIKGIGEEMPIDKARVITESGNDRLPPGMENLPFTNRHNCTVYIYEFRKDRKDGAVKFVKQSNLSAGQHINHILKRLRGN